MQTLAAGGASSKRTYDAFGKVVSVTGTWNGPTGYGGAFGYQEDGNGLTLLGHRWYDAEVGRFLTRDPIKDGRNWYAYCGNDPVSMVDPTGLTWYYNSKTGELWRVGEGPDDWGPSPDRDRGFSGKKGKSRNNPGDERKEGKGPIPRGRYKINPPRDKKGNGKSLPYNLPLTPVKEFPGDKKDTMFGRSHFLIHGGSEDGDPSQGCIILPISVREKIWKSGDHELIVVAPYE